VAALTFPPAFQSQVDELAREYGEPLLRTAAINSDAFWERDRFAEICMVVRRPNGLLLTAAKTFYPPETFRLLTGGIEPGERILDAVRREVKEETGLHADVERFLAAVGYVPADEPQGEPRFYTFAFLLPEIGGNLEPQDPEECVAAFREIGASELLAQAAHLDAMEATESVDLGERWDEWGRFRAVIHRVVYEALVER
jgi:NAD+ diphosphatase